MKKKKDVYIVTISIEKEGLGQSVEKKVKFSRKDLNDDLWPTKVAKMFYLTKEVYLMYLKLGKAKD